MTLEQYLDRMDLGLDDQELGRDEQERLEEERGRKLEALFTECEEMLQDINKEYCNLEAVTVKKFLEMFV